MRPAEPADGGVADQSCQRSRSVISRADRDEAVGGLAGFDYLIEKIFHPQANGSVSRKIVGQAKVDREGSQDAGVLIIVELLPEVAHLREEVPARRRYPIDGTAQGCAAAFGRGVCRRVRGGRALDRRPGKQIARSQRQRPAQFQTMLPPAASAVTLNWSSAGVSTSRVALTELKVLRNLRCCPSGADL